MSETEVTLPTVTSVIGNEDVLGAFRVLLAAAAEEPAPEESQEAPRGPKWEGPLAIEGKPTSDGRYLIPGEIGERDLPLPIAASHEDQAETETVGRIEAIDRIPAAEFDKPGWEDLAEELKDAPEQAVVIWGDGTFDGSPEADDAIRQMENGVGVSLDLPMERQAIIDAETYEEVDPSELSEEDMLGLMFGMTPEGYLRGIAGKIGGASLASIAAFEETRITIVGDHALVASGIMILPAPRVLTAAAGPVKPPAEWFDDPFFRELTPLTITKEGRVFGHLADWDGCHIGFQGICVPPFRSATDYAYFNTGEIETAEGDLIACGKLMFSRDGVGHADVDDENMSIQDVMAHYDDATCVGAFVRAGSDRYGTYLVGSLRHDLNDLEIQHLRTHPPSGDWRPVKGVGELIAAFSVPVGGFPIARRALVASANGEISAIISAPLEITEEMGYRKRKRKRVMLTQRLTESLGHRPSTRARMRREAMIRPDDAA